MNSYAASLLCICHNPICICSDPLRNANFLRNTSRCPLWLSILVNHQTMRVCMLLSNTVRLCSNVLYNNPTYMRRLLLLKAHLYLTDHIFKSVKKREKCVRSARRYTKCPLRNMRLDDILTLWPLRSIARKESDHHYIAYTFTKVRWKCDIFSVFMAWVRWHVPRNSYCILYNSKFLFFLLCSNSCDYI